MKVKLQWWIALVAAVSFVAMASTETSRTVVDDVGNTVIVPTHVTRVADAWFAHASLMMTLGEGRSMVDSVNHARSRPWMFTLQPSLYQARTVQGTRFNAETLLNDGVQLVFVAAGDPQVAALQRVGLPVMQMHFTTLNGLKQTLLNTAQAMGTSSAMTRAKLYNQYLDRQLSRIHAITAGLTENQKPLVLHISSLHPLKVDGRDTLINDWIQIAGGRNAAQSIKGNMQAVSAEQVLAWQPDIIILAADAGDIHDAPDAAVLQVLNAVQDGKVVRNPSGVFPWDRYGTESALQIQWAAQQLHPERLKQDDMVLITQRFYRQFFDYSLSTQQASLILQGLAPQ